MNWKLRYGFIGITLGFSLMLLNVGMVWNNMIEIGFMWYVGIMAAATVAVHGIWDVLDYIKHHNE